MSKCDSIEKVAEYWNNNPVHSIEFKQGGDLKGYLEAIDALRWSDNEGWARDRFYEFGQGCNMRLLDAGCGIGVFSRFYARQGFQVHAIDISNKAVEITRESLRLFDLKGEVKLASVEKIPYPDNYFDFIISNGVIHHTPDTEKAVEEFYRVLKPGGTASVCVYYRNIWLYQPFFGVIRFLLKVILKKKQGRELLIIAKTPEEFVRAYDGNLNPIAKVYTRQQANKLFKRFIILLAEVHYFPARFLYFLKPGGMLHRFLDKYTGVLIYYLLKKDERHQA